MLKPARSITSREFNQRTGDAKRAALGGPVYITDRGRPSHVLVTYEHYSKLTEGSRNLVDMLCSTPAAGGVDLEIPPRDEVARQTRID